MHAGHTCRGGCPSVRGACASCVVKLHAAFDNDWRPYAAQVCINVCMGFEKQVIVATMCASGISNN
jgi:hypothetical protein